MKICCTCKINQPFTNYHVNNASVDKLTTKCKKCVSRWGKENQTLQYRRNWYRDWKNGSILQAYKELSPCTDCKNYFPSYVMDFDHIPGKGKSFQVSMSFTRRRSWDEILTEMNKCELVCSNCHRIRTHNRRMERFNDIISA